MVAKSGAEAEKQRVVGSSPGVDENLGGVLVAESQDTFKVLP